MANRYWVGGTGSWSDTAHWSTTSGGTGGASVPTSADNVYFDANSFTATGQTVTVAVETNCLDMDWTGVTNNPTFYSNIGNAQNIYGDLILTDGMTINGAYCGYFSFLATSTGKIIKTFSKTCRRMLFSSATGGWTLLDDLNVGTSGLIVSGGSLNTNGKKINSQGVVTVSGTTTKSIDFTSSVITVPYFSATTPTNLTFNAGTSTIIQTRS